jgi:hypothetical protein
MRSLHEVHVENALWAGRVSLPILSSVCLSVRMIQLENHWTDQDAIPYGSCAIENCPKTAHFIFFAQ